LSQDLRRMSTIQKFLLAVLPAKWAQNLETESRQWIMKCPSCSHEKSIWDLGGIRWGAAGKPKRLMMCPQCRQLTWHEVSRRDAATGSSH
jgi:hypothetical protein